MGSTRSASLLTVSAKHLRIASHWLRFADPNNPGAEILAMPIDYDDAGWSSSRWAPRARMTAILSKAEGPVGLAAAA